MISMGVLVVMCVTYADGVRHCDVRASNDRQEVSTQKCKTDMDNGILKITKELMADEPGTLMMHTEAECFPVSEYAARLSSMPGRLQDLGYGEINIKFY